VPACPTCGEETPERARFCPSCGAPLIAREPPREDLRKIVTVLFTDLKGSTSMGERLDSESLRQLMRRYFATMEAILERHGGTVEKFIGDAIMAVFGVPSVREDDALRAVRAAAEMRSALGDLNEALEARWGVRLRVRTGVNTGEVVAGDPSRGHGFVTGDAVNVAARLEQAATEDEILIGEDTLRLVRDAVQVTTVEPLELKGKAEPVPAYRLLSVEAGAPGFSRRLDSALVGREDELGGLRAALEKVTAERSCALVSVLGAAGVGKSRLTAEFVATLGDEATVLEGRCLPYGEGITFWPVGEVLKAAAGITEEDAPEQMREKLASLVGGAEEAEPILQRMEGVLGLADAASSPVEIFWAVRRLIEGLAADRPVVLVFDDVHWAESTFLDLVEYLATSSRDAPILVLVMGRTELLELRPGLAGITTDSLSLEPLSGSETRSLVENLLGGGELDPAVAEHVLAAGEGNPLFVEEFLRLLVEEGQIEQLDGRWRAAGELAAASTPPTIQALIAARLDRLATGERAVIECAAVIGKSFWPSAVRELAPPEARDDVESHLAALVRKQLLAAADGARFAGEEGLAFSHIVVRDVAYQAMLKAVRADLHARTATWLEETAGERAVEYEEILGYHLEQAHRYLVEVDPGDQRTADVAARAAARLASAGGRALARYDMPAAVSLLERASSLLAEDDPTRRDLALKLGIALAGSGQLTRVNTLLSERLAAERANRSFVVYHEPTGRQQTVFLDDGMTSVSVGRRPDNDIPLIWDTQVSRRHALMERLGDGWVLVDDGTSRNGSYLNGDRVEGRHALSDGDVLRFGDTVLLYRSPEPARPVPAAPVEPEGVTTFGDNPLAAIQLSDVERLVLGELRQAGGGSSTPSGRVSDEEIAERVAMSEDQLHAVVAALELKFGIEGPSDTQRRERLIVRAVNSGLASHPGA
jgi:class 3 adenylate cyclase